MNFLKRLFESKEAKAKREEEDANKQKEKETLIKRQKAMIECSRENFILVEGGTYTMGSNDFRSNEKPAHRVAVSSFMIGKYQVTQELWESLMGSNPSKSKGINRPVENVRWHKAITFCILLNSLEGMQKVYSINGDEVSCDFSAKGYRLPTEAEWEYAARGGNKSKGYKYSGSDDISRVAWYDGNSGSVTHEVGTKSPNELGIYDMSGNVFEFCWDFYGEYKESSQTNPRGPITPIPDRYRVYRGGSWYHDAGYCRVSSRYDLNYIAGYPIGFRLVRTM